MEFDRNERNAANNSLGPATSTTTSAFVFNNNGGGAATAPTTEMPRYQILTHPDTGHGQQQQQQGVTTTTTWVTTASSADGIPRNVVQLAGPPGNGVLGTRGGGGGVEYAQSSAVVYLNCYNPEMVAGVIGGQSELGGRREGEGVREAPFSREWKREGNLF